MASTLFINCEVDEIRYTFIMRNFRDGITDAEIKECIQNYYCDKTSGLEVYKNKPAMISRSTDHALSGTSIWAKLAYRRLKKSCNNV